MNHYVERKIQSSNRSDYQGKICKFYTEICKKIFLVNSTSENEDIRSLIETLINHEANIWACIYRELGAPDNEKRTKWKLELDNEDP
jgi:hypothetical protein